jgi:16S rRNA (cytidine1402-2'-O)-methyltransferase
MPEIPQTDALTPNWPSMVSRLQQQDWPGPALYVVATPIGNLMDLSLRAWYALRLVDVIAAEDTRSSRALLQAWSIDTPLISAHRHNERAASDAVIARLQDGQRVALVSDAGAPGVSDPGGYLVQAVRAAGFRVVPIPGASALISALMATGLTTNDQPRFVFLGFLPARSMARKRDLSAWLWFEGTLLMYEAPHRIESLLCDLNEVFGATRQVCLARELTKRFEETVTLTLAQSLDWVAEHAHRQQGEYVVLLHPPEAQVAPSQAQEDEDWQTPQRIAWMSALLEVVSTRDAAKILSKALGQPKDQCYGRLLEHSRRREGGSHA